MTEEVDQHVEAGNPSTTLDPHTGVEGTKHSDADSIDDEAAPSQDSLRSELDAARREAAANYDKYLRSRADMENYKKHLERTYADRARASKKELLRKLLGVRDNLERALQYEASTSGACESLTQGVRLTRSQVDHLLSQEGVKPIEALGKPFDPRLEEAVQSVDDPRVPDHTVVGVLRQGYTFRDEDEVLRPAQVVVSVHSNES